MAVTLLKQKGNILNVGESEVVSETESGRGAECQINLVAGTVSGEDTGPFTSC